MAPVSSCGLGFASSGGFLRIALHRFPSVWVPALCTYFALLLVSWGVTLVFCGVWLGKIGSSFLHCDCRPVTGNTCGCLYSGPGGSKLPVSGAAGLVLGIREEAMFGSAQ